MQQLTHRLILYLCAQATVLLASNELLGWQVDLLDENRAKITARGCEISNEDGALRVVTSESTDSMVDFAISDSEIQLGAGDLCELRFRMQTTVNGDLGEYIFYWIAGDAKNFKQFQRIPFIADGEWHEYRLPIGAVGDVKTLRLTFGKQSHELQLADVELHRYPSELPTDLESDRTSLPSHIEISGGGVRVSTNCSDHTYEIGDSLSGRTWSSQPVSRWLKLYRAAKQNDHSLQLEMYDCFVQQPVVATIEIISERGVRFTIESSNPEAPIAASREYPPRFASDMTDGEIVFCDRSCGVRLDQQDRTYAHWPLRVYGNTHCLDMPWVGLYDGKQGDGMMLLVETPTDSEVALVADENGLHWPEVRWLPSLDRFGYRRAASLRFTDSGAYVGLAKCYREFLKEQGRFKTLAEKAKEKPNVNRLRGAPSLWGGRYPTKFIRQMRPLGITQGIVGTCKEPGLVAWLNDLGYLTGRYDNYTDIVEGNTKFLSDDVEIASVRSRPGGPPKLGWKKRSGEQMYWRSSARWANVEESYVSKELSRIPYNSRFIDVAAAADLLEDFHPDHTFDRRTDLENRRSLFRKMNQYGLVLGTEHGNDWVVDQVEYIEGATSGPFWWSAWPAGHLDRPSREQLTPNYLKYGMGYANRLPLWELVYHDCAVTTWYWGDTAGLLYEAAPELSDRKDLFNILYGTTPLFWMDGTGYRLPDQLHRMLRTFHDTCQLHQVVAFEQMTDHKFLSEDRAVQQTRFANGTVVAVNFSDEPRDYAAEGEAVSLAPRGFYVHGPDILQTRLVIDQQPQTVIAKTGYLAVESDGQQFIHGVKCNGRATMFKVHDKRWNLFVDPKSTCELSIPAVTGWSTDDKLSICYMDDSGEVKQAAMKSGPDGMVEVQATENVWRYALVREASENRVAVVGAVTHGANETESK